MFLLLAVVASLALPFAADAFFGVDSCAAPFAAFVSVFLVDFAFTAFWGSSSGSTESVLSFTLRLVVFAGGSTLVFFVLLTPAMEIGTG